MKRKLLALASVLFLAPLAVACGDDDQGVIRDAGGGPDVITPIPTGTTNPEGGGPDGGGPQLFTDFVKDIVAKDTTPTNLPRTVNDKTFAPDPEDRNAFPATFFQ